MATVKLHVSEDLSLPLDFITERIAFLARTGAGKSGGMRVLAEQMCEADLFFIFLDPKGDAWGIRSDYSVLIMGGEHGDVPLDARSGSFVADFLVKERISTVLDVSEFSEADMVRFIAPAKGGATRGTVVSVSDSFTMEVLVDGYKRPHSYAHSFFEPIGKK